MGVLNVSNLSKHFGGFTAVDNISFTIESAEILGLLGPNGAGKTTTIQMLLGVLTPSSGSISYFGRELSAHRSEILEQVNFSSTYTKVQALAWTLVWVLAPLSALYFPVSSLPAWAQLVS